MIIETEVCYLRPNRSSPPGFFSFTEDDFNRAQIEFKNFPELIGHLALIRKMDVFRIIGE
jgi:hypothetical protein